jgi:hypothetical protein
MWIDFFRSISPECSFNLAGSMDDINASETKLNVILPKDIKSILLESNGVEGIYGLGLIWSIERIIEDNIRIRNDKIFKEIYMSFDNLLFFADSGMGDQFAFPIVNRTVCKQDVFVWNHEDDSRNWVAPTVSKYVEWWLKGKIKI